MKTLMRKHTAVFTCQTKKDGWCQLPKKKQEEVNTEECYSEADTHLCYHFSIIEFHLSPKFKKQN